MIKDIVQGGRRRKHRHWNFAAHKNIELKGGRLGDTRRRWSNLGDARCRWSSISILLWKQLFVFIPVGIRDTFGVKFRAEIPFVIKCVVPLLVLRVVIHY